MDISDCLRRWIPFILPLKLGQRIGLSVSAELIGAIIVRGSAVQWSVLETIGPEDTLVIAITRVLRHILAHSHASWIRPGVWVAIDTSHAQVKTVRGLPPVSDARVVAQLLAATPERFFLGSVRQLVTTGVRLIAPGVAQAAAFEVTMLDDVQEACAVVGLETTLFVPAALAIAAAPSRSEDKPSQTREILAAYGATQVERHEPLIVRRSHLDAPSSSGHLRRLVIAGVVAAVSVSVALATPIGLALRASRTARYTIMALAPARARALTTEHDIGSMTAAINTVNTFEQHRISKTLLVSELTQTLPAAATITTLTVDTTGTTVIVLAPTAADVVRDIQELPGISHVEILGPVTREFTSTPGKTLDNITGNTLAAGVTPVEMERVTVRFRLTAEGMTARRHLGETE